MSVRAEESESAQAVGPLEGRRILVTRAPHQASVLAEALRAEGAEPILIPTIAIEPPESFAALDAALARIVSYDWLVFTSANAVEAFYRRTQTVPIAHPPRQIAAIGAATERAALSAGLTVDVVAPRPIPESLAEALAPFAPGRSFLIVRAAEARDVLPEALRRAGAHVAIAEAYRNRLPDESVSALREVFSAPSHRPDAVTFTSASTARNLAGLLERAELQLPSTIVRASIGPVTSAAMTELGLPPHVEAGDASIPALVDALRSHFAAAVS